MFDWGETVLGRHAGALIQGKLESRWSEGVWLGKEASSNDHVVATETEILYCRTVKAVPDADQKPHLLQQLRLTPWQTTLPGAKATVASRAGRAATAHTKVARELEAFKLAIGRHPRVLGLSVRSVWPSPFAGKPRST